MKNIFMDEEGLERNGFARYNGEKMSGFIQPETSNTLLNHLANKVIHFDNTKPLFEKKRRTRVILKKGIENISVLLSQIVLFYTEDKIVFALNNIGKKYIAEISLIELEQELDDRTFFRANRQYIININYIKSFLNYEKVKLRVKMEPEELNDKYCIIISQEKAPVFKRWIYAA